MIVPVDDPLRCRCARWAERPPYYAGAMGCAARATAEDMLCDACRATCNAAIAGNLELAPADRHMTHLKVRP